MAIAIDGGLGALTAEANQRGSSGKRQQSSSSAWHRAGRSVMGWLSLLNQTRRSAAEGEHAVKMNKAEAAKAAAAFRASFREVVEVEVEEEGGVVVRCGSPNRLLTLVGATSSVGAGGGGGGTPNVGCHPPYRHRKGRRRKGSEGANEGEAESPSPSGKVRQPGVGGRG